jgi:hypothetical protein
LNYRGVVNVVDKKKKKLKQKGPEGNDYTFPSCFDSREFFVLFWKDNLNQIKKDDEINYFFYLKNDQNKRYCNLIRDRLATANRKLLLQ